VKIPLEGKIRVADSIRHARVNGIACVDDHDMRAVDAQFESVQQAVVELIDKRVLLAIWKRGVGEERILGAQLEVKLTLRSDIGIVGEKGLLGTCGPEYSREHHNRWDSYQRKSACICG